MWGLRFFALSGLLMANFRQSKRRVVVREREERGADE
jgi:hypothetical protein